MDSPVFDRCRWDEIPPDEEDVFGWATDLFGVASYALQWATPEWRFLVRIENKPVVHIAVLRRTVTVAGRDKPVGGISRLVTVPQLRNRSNRAPLTPRTRTSFPSTEVESTNP